MPLLSVVVVVHGEQAYLGPLAESILNQSFEDVELVAIDDASRDHAPAVLAGLAERDPRVTVRRVDRRVGLGEARNAGLDLARGDFVWFVNTTDLVAPGGLASVAERLGETRPDLLVVRHDVQTATGEVRRGSQRELLTRAAKHGPAPLDELRGLEHTATRLWDKVLRRELLVELGVRFGAAGHSELTVTWPAMLAANRIAALPEPAYLRRPRENAVRDRHVTGSPFDVFAQYDEVLALAERRGEPLPRRARAVPRAMLRHELALLEHVPEERRRDFFSQISRGYRRHRRGDEQASLGRAAAARARLVEHDNYSGFRALSAGVRVRRGVARRRAALSRRRGRAVKRLRDERLERWYRSRLRQPVDPDLAVFAAYWYRGYSCNPRAIYEKARELVPGLRGIWVVRGDAVDRIPAGVDYVVAGTREYYDVIARARYLVNNVNFPNHLVKREGSVHVMTHHGTPLKTMGMDQAAMPVSGPRIDFDAMLRRCRRWDFSVSANAHSTLIWERVYPTRYESIESGYPRNDVLATAGESEVETIRSKLDLPPEKTVILYAPTHREYHSGYVAQLDLAAFAGALGGDHVVLARSHYFYGGHELLRRLHAEGVIRDVSAHPSAEELCLAADVLVTDYSSIMFDYAVLDRPIAIHAPDWELYVAARGTYFDLLDEPPGTVARTDADLVEAFRSGAVWSDEARARRAAFRTRFCSLEDGRAAERVVRRVWFGERVPAPARDSLVAT